MVPWGCLYRDPALPAWIQALGSIVAILSGYLVAISQANKAREQAKLAQNEARYHSIKRMYLTVLVANNLTRQARDHMSYPGNMHKVTYFTMYYRKETFERTLSDFELILSHTGEATNSWLWTKQARMDFERVTHLLNKMATLDLDSELFKQFKEDLELAARRVDGAYTSLFEQKREAGEAAHMDPFD